MNNKNKILIFALVILSIGAVYFLKNSSSKKYETVKVENNVAKNDSNSNYKDSKKNSTEENKTENKTENTNTESSIEPLEADSSISMENLIKKGKPFILEFSQRH